MPFTPAHPLAVWPLVRWHRALQLDATCLVVGSMAPDFEYFIHGEQKGNFGHTLLGIPLWGIPATMILAALFHALVKWPLLIVAPRWLAQRSIEAAARPWPGTYRFATIASLLISAGIGDVTHLAWDAFTHSDGFGERHFPVLGSVLQVPMLGKMVLSRVLQYGCSVLGLIGVALWMWRSLRLREAHALAPAPVVSSRLVFLACVGTGMPVVMFRAIRILHATDPGSIVVSAISGLLAGTLIASAILHRRGLELQTKTNL